MVPLIFRRATSTFRTRNRRRDLATDAARLAGVRDAIEQAIADADREREGLQRRLELYMAKASSLMDGTGEFFGRAAEDEAELRLAERHITEARRRLGILDGEARRLGQLLDMVDGTPKAEVA